MNRPTNNPAPEKGFCLLRLDAALAVLRVEGADADGFLQAQLSSDLRRLAPERAQLSSYNSPKGRMLAAPTLVRRPSGAVDMELPRELIEPIARRLRMFVLRAKVQIAEAQESILGLRGAEAAAALAAAGLPVPEAVLGCSWRDDMLIQRRPGPEPRYLLRGPRGPADALASRWSGAERGLVQWTLDDVLAGLPVVLAGTQDRFVPQMANLDRIGGIAFDKGCYTGQEIVARLHYLGQTKRRLFLCTGAGDPPQPGTPVHAAGEAQAVGEVMLAAAAPEGGFAASVVLQIGHATSAQLQAGQQALSAPREYDYSALVV